MPHREPQFDDNHYEKDTSREDWQLLHDHAEANRDNGWADVADDLARTGPLPENLGLAPMIIDTDIGDDPDDTFALAIAALHVPQLRLVITSDECDGLRARFVRHYLDLLGRQDVVVAQGSNCREGARQRIDHIEVPEASISCDVLSEVGKVLEWADGGGVRWVGIGAFTNLAMVINEAPHLASRLGITMMGGAINYRHPNRASHNIHIDIEAARTVVNNAKRLKLILSDHTYRPEIRVGPDSPIYQGLRDTAQPDTWEALLLSHLEAWFALAPHEPVGTLMNDPLTLSTAMGMPWVRSQSRDIRLDDIGRTIVDDGGRPALLSERVQTYADFMNWVARSLGVDVPDAMGEVVPLRL